MKPIANLLSRLAGRPQAPPTAGRPTRIRIARRAVCGFVRDHKGLSAAALVTFLGGALAVLWVLLPAYRDPANGMFNSQLGYGRIMRALGMEMPVATAPAQEREFCIPLLGEGTLTSEPVLVPVIPMAKVTAVHVEEGDFVRRGQLLAELDPTQADLKVQSARLAISTAEAERERVRIGSAYVLAQERPGKDKIDLGTATETAERSEEKLASYRELHKRGIISRTKLLDAEREHLAVLNTLQNAEFNIRMSTEGMPYSLAIAENAIADTQKALAHRIEELENYKIFAPADGIVERVLIREGEYNQDSGKPGFVLASQLWFEAHLDQSALPDVAPGAAASVHLEAYPGRPISARLTKIIPFVSFNQGGPEVERPLRPRGTGSPEWAATFRVRLEFDRGTDALLAAGMTGFARITAERNSLAVPRAAVLSISAGTGLVCVPDSAGGWQSKAVEIGYVDGDWVEIRDGLLAGEQVISKGHRILKQGDRIGIEPSPGGNAN